MNELNLKEIQQIAFDILCEFDDFCQIQSLRYSLGGGSLLGAIRHKGFIPWDDDIDIMMPRPDYERFLELASEEEFSFNCLSNQATPGYDDLFCKLSDKSTFVIDSSTKLPYEMGVSIDIFPIDGLGDSLDSALKNFSSTKFKRELLIASRWQKFFRSKTRSIWVEPIRMGFFCFSRFVNGQKLSKTIDSEIKKIDFDSSQFAGCVSGVYREKEIMKTEVFQNYTDVPFEDRTFKSISNYHDYLTQHYGDYMQPPKKDKQVSHHTAKFYRKEDFNV